MTPIIGSALPRTPARFPRSYREATGRDLHPEDFDDYVERDLTWGKVIGAGLVILTLCYLWVIL